MQFEINDTVVHITLGLCRIKRIEFMSFSSDRPKEKYYVLSPFSSSCSTCYVPVKNGNSHLRRPLNKEDFTKMINEAKLINVKWNDNRQLRNDYFNSILSKGLSAELIALVACIYKRKNMLSIKNKMLSSTEESVLKNAEALLNEELSYVFRIEKDKSGEYISDFFKG